jgi:hypothetical protein
MSSRRAALTSPVALSLACFGLAALSACGVPGDSGYPADALLGGDADWPGAPIPQPGGNGAPAEGNPGDDGGATGGGTGGDGDTDPSGDGDGDGDPTTGDGDGDPTTGDGDGDPDQFMCLAPAEGLSCGDQDGICEAAPVIDPPVLVLSCCDDEDCGCVDGLCSAGPCEADGWCDCHCPNGADPDCQIDSCAQPAPAAGDPVDEVASCPDSTAPVVLYMSNDDSNSQASPAYVRSLVAAGYRVPASAVRVHEFLNYYDLHYAPPKSSAAKVAIQMRRTNADTGEFTLLLSAQGKQVAPEQRPPFNLVYALDLSGSMSGEPIELLAATVRATAGQLREGDRVSMVGWDTLQSTLLDGHVVSGPDDPTLLAAIDSIASGGGTDLHAGLVSAYTLANQHYLTGGINRVVLISDGGANAGVTDIDLIGAEANDQNGEGIYLLGVGVSRAGSYSDKLMDEVTDAGKGAYLFVDSEAEAERMFGDPERFLANTMIVARDVQMELTMPWYFGIKEFHGEEYSADPAEVEPQHLGANDAMSFHQTLQSCDPSAPKQNDLIKAKVNYRDPLTLQETSDELTLPLQMLVTADADQLYKADVIVNYAKAFIALDAMLSATNYAQAVQTADEMSAWLALASAKLDDPEVAEMAGIMADYAAWLTQTYG